MDQNLCPSCGKTIERQTGAAFCPFCGGSLASKAPDATEPQAVRDLLAETADMTDLRKKHQLLLEAEKEYPGSLAIAQELLYMGRLYERNRGNADFSIIKCFLLNLYLTPEHLPKKRQEEMRTELFSHPQLLKCMELSDDPEGFLREYLLRMSHEFITLFVRGDSRYSQRIFGFSLGGNPAKLFSTPAAKILLAMRQDNHLTPQQRDVLMRQFYTAFAQDVSGETKWLDEKLNTAGVTMTGK